MMMADLLDIAPATAVESVHIAGGQRITVRGLHGNDIAAIVARFPAMIAVFAGGGDNVVTLFSSLGQAAGAIIAAGCGHLGDENAEQIAGSFLFEDQLRLFKAIFALTFPNGLSPVMETIAGLVNGAAKQQQKVRVRLKRSPSESQPLSDADSRPIMQ
jgi:hypothetical protein